MPTLKRLIPVLAVLAALVWCGLRWAIIQGARKGGPLTRPVATTGPAAGQAGDQAVPPRPSPTDTFAPVPTPAGADYLIVSAEIDAVANRARLEPMGLMLGVDPARVETPVPGGYAIRFLDADETVVADYPCSAYGVYDGPPNMLLMVESVPWVPGTQRIALISGTAEIDSWTVSPHAPRISLLSPNGGERVASPYQVTVRWESGDEDGDLLTYDIEYSADNGLTWEGLASLVYFEGSSYTVDLGVQPGSERARIRVTVDDGVNTAYDVSDGPFSLARKPPRVTIERPYSGKAILPDGQVLLEGAAKDVEDGNLPASALSWRSDIDGPLGTGSSVIVKRWSPGLHTITLTAADSDGLKAAASITLTVWADADGDALPDDWEVRYGLDANDKEDARADLDRDSLDNDAEYYWGTLPNNPDTDGDGFLDGMEAALGADPLAAVETGTVVTLHFTGNIQYHAGFWSDFHKPSETLLPYPGYHFCFNVPNEVWCPTIAVPGESMERTIAVLKLEDAGGDGLAGATAAYYDDGWQPIPGETDQRGVLGVAIPGRKTSVRFRIALGDLAYEKTQDLSADSFVIFRPSLPPTPTPAPVPSFEGGQANGDSFGPAISADGRYVAFYSYATNLGAGRREGLSVCLHDRQTGRTIHIAAARGARDGNGRDQPSISGDGRFVAFQSYSPDLVSGDSNGKLDVFVYDRGTQRIARVSIDSNGKQGDGASLSPSISADGRYVAFCSYATNLVPNDYNFRGDVFVHDRQTGQTACISVDPQGRMGNGPSERPFISASGRYVAFESFADSLVPGDTNRHKDVFVRDRERGVTMRASVDSKGREADWNSWYASISADGRYVAFASEAANLVEGETNRCSDVFIHDRHTGGTRRVAPGRDGDWIYAASVQPSISADGRYVTFASASNRFTGDKASDKVDVFIYDRVAGQTSGVSLVSEYLRGDDDSYRASVSADGRYVAFQSQATNLVPGDTNQQSDIFVLDRESGRVSRVSIAGLGPGS